MTAPERDTADSDTPPSSLDRIDTPAPPSVANRYGELAATAGEDKDIKRSCDRLLRSVRSAIDRIEHGKFGTPATSKRLHAVRERGEHVRRLIAGRPSLGEIDLGFLDDGRERPEVEAGLRALVGTVKSLRGTARARRREATNLRRQVKWAERRHR